jgi:hypothetical protein
MAQVISENCPACYDEPKERQRVKQLLAQQESPALARAAACAGRSDTCPVPVLHGAGELHIAWKKRVASREVHGWSVFSMARVAFCAGCAVRRRPLSVRTTRNLPSSPHTAHTHAA